MADPFVHLHVASGYSLQYGASHPHVLVERAAEQEMDTLALTDRDGTYGAVRFVKAAMAAGIRPILGVDLAFVGSPDGWFRDARWRSLLNHREPAPHPDPRRRLPRRPAAPGHLPGQWEGRVGGGVPAGLGDPPRRRARHPGVHPRAGGRARRRARRPGAARAGLGAGSCGHAASRRPRGCGAASLARPGRARAARGRGGLPPGAGLGTRVLAACRPDDGAGPDGRPGCGPCSPTRSGSPTGWTLRRSTYSTPPGAWCRWTSATSTAATPRGS